MSSQFSVNLVIEHQSSRRLSLLYGLLCSCAVLGVGVVDFPVLLKLVLFVAVCCESIAVFRRHILLLNPDSVAGLTCLAEQWTLHTRDGNSRPARLLSAACWLFDIIPLVFVSAEGSRFVVLLTPDRTRAGPLRELRAWIRHRLPAA